MMAPCPGICLPDRRATRTSQYRPADEGLENRNNGRVMKEDDPIELLSVAEMYAADRAAMVRGISGDRLMESAGRAVVDEIRRRWADRFTVVLCGPGNNGGDGFVVARLLADAGWKVRVALLGARENLSGDARLNADRWTGDIEPLDHSALRGCELVVDALFGAGLSRPLDGVALDIVRRVNVLKAPCVSIDMPSGVHGDSGLVLSQAVTADLTVTFFRLKPGHLLLPGRARAGETVVADIGIPADVLTDITAVLSVNEPPLWEANFPWPRLEDHKYTRGHVLIAGGVAMSGAARLAVRAARRIGAGLVSVASGPEALPIYAADAPGVLTLPYTTADEFADLLRDQRKNAVLIGPGSGVNRTTHDIVLHAARQGRSLVLDADALSAFSDDPSVLFDELHGLPCVLTPHQGEFSRLFRLTGDKLTRVREAARLSQAVVLLKGADTVIAAPDGRAAINRNAPPTLATAGAGDVLAGMIVGLMAQKMPTFEAACAACWLHGASAAAFGDGLIAEDVVDNIPAALSQLRARIH